MLLVGKILVFLFSLIGLVKCQNALPSGCLDIFRSTGLALHNQLRARHGTPPLKQSSVNDASSLAWANTMASTGVFQHSTYGENLWAESNSGVLTLSECARIATSCVQSWYNEISLYNYNAPGFSVTTGHFTQLIWKSSTDLGMGLSWGKSFSGSGSGYYCVAHYTPYVNDGRLVWTDNVLPLISVVTTASTRQSSILTTLSSASTASTTRPISLSSTSSPATCQDLAGYESVCMICSAPPYNYCSSSSSFIGNGILFSKGCSKSCKMC